MELTEAELASIAETWEHINLVMQLMSAMQIELMKRAFTHDRTKLMPLENSVFAQHTPFLKASVYGSEEYKQRLAAMSVALDHHYAHNRHHPEFFENGVNDMNLIDLLEMMVDWYAASKRHDDGDIHRSIAINQERFGLSNQLTQILKNSVALMDAGMSFEQFKTQKDI